MKVKVFTTTLLSAAALCSCQQEIEKPNVLFLLVDDMQADAIAALGNPDVHTPHIDGLMSQGVTFTHTYTNGALCGALSMPSRAMLITGRGVFGVQSDGMKIPETHTTFPEHFRNQGYRTFATGKWHSDFASFNRSFAEGENIFFGGMHPYETQGHTAPRLRHYDPTGEYKEKPFVGDKFSSEMFANAAVEFIHSTAKDKNPFLAYVAFTSPHDPRNILPTTYGHRYQAASLTLPSNFLPEHPFDNGELAIRDELVLPPPRTGEQIQNELALYYGMVSEVDEQIGRVLKALDDTGERSNTIIVFASDNGLAVGQNGLIGKQSLYEHSVGVPMLIIDPRTKNKGAKSDALCYLYDIYPTLCDLAQIETPASVQGQSLKAVLDEPAKAHRPDLFLAYSNQQRALVKDNYKYIIYNVEDTITEQLFNLKDDSGELKNLADKQPEKVAEMKALLHARMKENNDFCDLSSPKWWKDGHKITWDELVNLYIFDK